MRKAFILVYFLFAVTQIQAQTTGLKPGTEFEIQYQTVASNATDYKNEQYVFQFKTETKIGPNAVYGVKLMKMYYNLGGKDYDISFSSDNIRNRYFEPGGIMLQLALLQKPLTITVNPQSEILKIDGVDEAIDQSVGTWVLNKDLTNNLHNNVAQNIKAWIQSFFLKLPEKEIDYRSAWTAADGAAYKITAISGALLTVAMTNSPSGKISGNSYYNTVTGLTERVNNNGTKINEVNIKGVKKKAAEFSYAQSLGYTINKYPLDTAWLNMAIRTSWNSTALKQNVEFDAEKMAKYFAANNSRFGKDPYYLYRRLSMTQQADHKNNFKLYDNLLKEIPNYVIAGESSHLHNKIGSVLLQSADSAYEVSKYLRKTESWVSWLHESYAQDFLHANADQFKTSYTLLERFHADKDPLMQPYVNALYLWVTAKKNIKNQGILAKIAQKFIRMSDAEMNKGDGGRYALLVHKLLVQAGKKKQADILLESTIKKLLRYTADTLNSRHLDDKNILAYAYYVKYEAAKDKEPATALQYLSQAALYSPKDQNDIATTNFYDQVFLRSKENYRKEFIEQLFKNGDKELGLKIFAEHINGAPENLPEMQKIYEQQFPGQSFKAFFNDRILPQWRAAPAFTLKGMDGKNIALADYKNKWLVLDFWGTWCSPCRDEMPKLNAYYQEIKSGKRDGVDFLSIACSDTENNVRSFFAANKYELPVTMSNNVVEKEYKIVGFPSKIIVSPDGRMIQLSHDQGWKELIEQFKTLYVAN